MVGRIPGNIRAVRPLHGGVIADFNVAQEVIKYLLLHRRHDEVSPGTYSRRPALRDSFEAGVEPYAVHAVDVESAEKRPLPPPETVKCHGYRDWHVDTDHADFHSVCKFSRGITVAGENGNAVAKLMVIDKLCGRVEIGFTDHG